MPEIQQVAVDPPGRPFPVSPEGLDELHDGRRGALRAVPWDRGTIGQPRLTGGEIAGHPGRHRRAAEAELGGRVGFVPLQCRGRDSYNYSPQKVRFDGHVRLRRGEAGAHPAHSDGLIRRLSVPHRDGGVVTHHSIAPK